jgi:hypothetical protein
MQTSSSLFRRQAIDHHTAPRLEGELLRLDWRRIEAVRIASIIGLAAALVAAAAFARVPRYARGLAVTVGGGRNSSGALLALALPEATALQLAQGQNVTVWFADGAPLSATVLAPSAGPADRSRRDRDAAACLAGHEVAVPAALPAGVPAPAPGTRGTVVVRVGAVRLGALLLERLW